uniref:Uncharacterized protein n=1 Tax=viral metagenome TaxID=1070528 RepID=A0A6M3J7E5_9ZZZZ
MLGGNLVTRSLVGNRLVGGTWVASGTWTLPAVTLSGTVNGGGQILDNIARVLSGAVTNNLLLQATVGGGSGGAIVIKGSSDSSGAIDIYTPNAALNADVLRMTIAGGAAAGSGLITLYDPIDSLLYKVSGTQVVGARVVDARCDDVVDSTYGAEEAGVLDALRDAMISHGLISAA